MSLPRWRGGSCPLSFHDQGRRSKIKSWFLKGTLAAMIALPALSSGARAGGSDDYGCSNATLKGEYAFGVTGYTPYHRLWQVSKYSTVTATSVSVITRATAFAR